jgi:hypothetical protein
MSQFNPFNNSIRFPKVNRKVLFQSSVLRMAVLPQIFLSKFCINPLMPGVQGAG